MANNVEISVRDIKLSKDKQQKIRLLSNEIFDILNINNWELSIVICGNDFIKKLNKDYREKDEPTDVLSFPQNDDSIPVTDSNIFAGDIIISIETLEENSQNFKVSVDEEFKRVLLHGILHLMGYTHKDNNPNEEMLIYQEDLLKRLTGVTIF